MSEIYFKIIWDGENQWDIRNTKLANSSLYLVNFGICLKFYIIRTLNKKYIWDLNSKDELQQ